METNEMIAMENWIHAFLYACYPGCQRLFFSLEEWNKAAKARPRVAKRREEKWPLVPRLLNLISVLCCRLGNHAFPKPIRVVVSRRLGNHAFRKPITVVGLFRTRTNSALVWWYGNEFLGSCDQTSVSRLLFWFSGILIFSTGLLSQGSMHACIQTYVYFNAQYRLFSYIFPTVLLTSNSLLILKAGVQV